MHGKGSRNKLTPWHAQFYPRDDMLDALGRALCRARSLPRKELHEAWEIAEVVCRRFCGGRVVDLCCGQGLLGQVMLLVDESITNELAVDAKLPLNHGKVHDAVAAAFPRVRDRVRFVQARLDEIELLPTDVVVSSHACAGLTDAVLARASDAGARVAVLPCCHFFRFRADLDGHPDPARAMDEERVERLRARGYDVVVSSISEEVSPKNRLILGEPRRRLGAEAQGATSQ
jgi:hypothetical protein